MIGIGLDPEFRDLHDDVHKALLRKMNLRAEAGSGVTVESPKVRLRENLAAHGNVRSWPQSA
jgi:hypothetical protein